MYSIIFSIEQDCFYSECLSIIQSDFWNHPISHKTNLHFNLQVQDFPTIFSILSYLIKSILI